MKILALEREINNFTTNDFKPYLKAEAAKVLELYESGIIREIYFTKEHNAVIILECQNEIDAENILNSLPLVKENLIKFEIIPLLPYNGFSRLVKLNFAGK